MKSAGNAFASLFGCIAILLVLFACPSPVPPVQLAVSAPQFSPAGATYTSDQTVTITCATPGATIYYTSSGANPTTASPSYSGTISIAGDGTTITIKAFAMKSGMNDSSINSASYMIIYPKSHPVINEIGNAYYRNSSVAIELYNGTAATINLSNYKLRTGSRTNDGSSYSNGGVRIFPLPPMDIPTGGYAVIRGKVSSDYASAGYTVSLDDGASPYPNYPWYSASAGFAELLDSSGTQTIDFVRWGIDSTSPVSAGFIFQGSLPGFSDGSQYIGYALCRDFFGTNTSSSTDWTIQAWSTLGGRNDVTTDSASDGDGIPDSAKSMNGTFAGLPLYLWGARQGQKDIFIHIDYMESTDQGIIPQEAALDKVKTIFASQGYEVHFDVGNLFSSFAGDTANYNLDGRSHQVPYQQSVTLGDYPNYANAYQYKVNYMPIAKQRVFFYMLFGSSQNADGSSGSGGLAQIAGATSLITQGNWGLKSNSKPNTNMLINLQAASVMHEFGHNLGLRHGGDEETNNKPNYFSIMNYLYAYVGLPTIGVDDDTRYYSKYKEQQGTINASYLSRTYWSNWVAPPTASPSSYSMNYSNGTGGLIDENHVNDTMGIMRQGALHIDYAMIGSTSTTNHSVDILANLSGTTPGLVTLHDFNDWGAISSVFQRNYTSFNAGPLFRKSVTTGPNMISIPMIFNNPCPEISGPCASISKQ